MARFRDTAQRIPFADGDAGTTPKLPILLTRLSQVSQAHTGRDDSPAELHRTPDPILPCSLATNVFLLRADLYKPVPQVYGVLWIAY